MKKNKNKGNDAPAPAGTTETAGAAATVEQAQPQTETTQPEPQTATVVTEPAKPAPIYGVIMNAEELGKRHFRKGFETVLIAELGRGPGSVDMLVERLLASGEYQRVAPKAAENRPAKPVQELCNRWVGSKVLAVASEEEAAVVRLAHAAEVSNTVAEAIENATDATAPVPEAAAESEPVAASV